MPYLDAILKYNFRKCRPLHRIHHHSLLLSAAMDMAQSTRHPYLEYISIVIPETFRLGVTNLWQNNNTLYECVLGYKQCLMIYSCFVIRQTVWRCSWHHEKGIKRLKKLEEHFESFQNHLRLENNILRNSTISLSSDTKG